MNKDKMARLRAAKTLTQMAEDAELARVRAAMARRNATLEALRRLESGVLVEPTDIAAQCARGRYALWQERQRRHLNMRLAKETAEWLTLRETATRAVGRNDSLRRLLRKLES
ncbi:hypothetical protein ACFQXB_00170 [Plastorhodobacter daqingensis]|uniref:Transposase n=1 Tax=Plastorhodobacter daqingensis TaxID=1387281 RepID=A0ABW2UD81_9RHOB